MVDQSVKGKEYEPFTYVVERGKVREFLLAIGEDATVYQAEDMPLPPTLPTVFMFWGGGGLEDALRQIGVEIWNVLHAEQEYEYFHPVHIGDRITGQTRISDVYDKAGMNFVAFETEYANQDGEIVIKDRALIIVRGEEQR
jgi:hypothetical protein